MIRNPKMVYKVWRRDISSDERFGPSNFETSTLIKTCLTPEEILDALEFGKWMKVTYEVADPPSIITHRIPTK